MNLKRIGTYFTGEKRLLILSFLMGLIFTITVAAFGSLGYSVETQREIADGLLRFHVRANSNSMEDQQLKVIIKDRVLDKYGENIQNIETKKETIEYLKANLSSIKEYTEAEVRSLGYDYPVNISIMEDYFPTKSYGDITLPTGEYDALRIDIGDSEGDNWWCVMFPPLCYVDIAQEKLDDRSKRRFQQILTEEGYELISKHEEEIPIKIKFKIVEWWQKNLNAPMYARNSGAKR